MPADWNLASVPGDRKYHSLGSNTLYHPRSSCWSRAANLQLYIHLTSRRTRCSRFLDTEHDTQRGWLPNFPRQHLVCSFRPCREHHLANFCSWSDVTNQILRYSADRTSIMSFANFPLLFLFGGRSSILIWATGWSFTTVNIFHRHVARIATLQAVAHSVLYLVIYIESE